MSAPVTLLLALAELAVLRSAIRTYSVESGAEAAGAAQAVIPVVRDLVARGLLVPPNPR